MLRKIRIILAAVFFIGITLLFLGICEPFKSWLGWMPHLQLLPAVMALNFAVVIGVAVLTLLFGRIYCSVICPLGVMQDIISYLSGKRKGKKLRFVYSPAVSWLRYLVLAFFIAALIFGFHALARLLAPYSSYGRIASSVALLWRPWNPAFIGTVFVAAAMFAIVFLFAWRGGRTYCNTICPVGTVLGVLSRFAIFRPFINTSKCVNCKVCAKKCKSSCIDVAKHKIDYSRCVTCGDCIENCSSHAISYRLAYVKRGNHNLANEADNKNITEKENNCSTHLDSSQVSETGFSRRNFLTTAALLASTAAIAKEKKLFGGRGKLLKGQGVPPKELPTVPPGAVSVKNLTDKCTACQLCIVNCPGHVLSPSLNGLTFMQPEMSFDSGYCRPDCVSCSNLCPAGAIIPIAKEKKKDVHIGHAVWLSMNCIVFTKDVKCGLCGKNCPYGAITMVTLDPERGTAMPVTNDEICVGCGACENICPAKPLKAIYVEGYKEQKM